MEPPLMLKVSVLAWFRRRYVRVDTKPADDFWKAYVGFSSAMVWADNWRVSSIGYIQCPANFSLRKAGTKSSQQLNPSELHYLQRRRQQIAGPAYVTFLRNVQQSLKAAAAGKKNRPEANTSTQSRRDSNSTTSSNSVLPKYLETILASKDLNILPRTALATSGGGFRASLYASGVLNAFDGRNKTSAQVGTGGLLQASDYVVGLSGGAWVVTALAQANFPTLYDLALSGRSPKGKNTASQFGSLLLQYDLFSPADNQTVPDGKGIEEKNAKYLADIAARMGEKVKAGFHVTIVDFWSLMLRYHIITGTTESNFFDQSLPHGIDVTFSGIRNAPTFQRFEQPFPIITATSLSPRQDETKKQPSAFVPLTNTAYEFTPIESGSWDTNLASFIPTEYLGTRLKGGKSETQKCAQGFDQASYLAAVSSNIFPKVVTSPAYLSKQSPVFKVMTLINTTFGSFQPGIPLDTASVPNPFFQEGTNTYLDKTSADLRLLDGGYDGSMTPYLPMLQPARKVDIIIGIDAVSLAKDGAVGNEYATGDSLRAASHRAQLSEGAYSFPRVPSSEAEYEKIRSHPNFFGCNEPEVPLIVWLPNSAPLDGSAGITNTSVDQLQYPRKQVESFLGAASEIGYRGFPSEENIKNRVFRDPHWSACLACAVVDRSRERQKIPREGLCNQCFQRYCWNPSK
ncbi:uncharacterized protein MELLADRAFT_110225 [Melampsora larici-populina 98AG31]|uniref:Lysophospholipase n=1 Tax=Melampsora larici-populina (strain 98AG31 / pathotype 3-4-7) TaxID=747676 RepID=F4RZ30_MELLP|nr:uncharacterized protein MELLADRAFT_110225 [Melampsora larici-populina 98AG31]EGG02394.1 hypothetical protein MELLADRAFT_110225 [Melampsora larici-populina 98AG31]